MVPKWELSTSGKLTSNDRITLLSILSLYMQLGCKLFSSRKVLWKCKIQSDTCHFFSPERKEFCAILWVFWQGTSHCD